METLLIWIIGIMVALSLIGGIASRQQILEEKGFTSIMHAADMLVLMIGVLIMVIADVSVMNQFVEEKLLRSYTGGVLIIFIGNVLIFASPLITLGIGRLIRRGFNRIQRRKTIHT